MFPNYKSKTFVIRAIGFTHTEIQVTIVDLNFNNANKAIKTSKNKMVKKFCCCVPLEKGCICISILGIAISGVIFVVHENLWTVLSLLLSVISGGFLLVGAIKYTRISMILYIIFEIIHIVEMFTAVIIIFVDLIAFRNFKCYANCHCYWVAIGSWNSGVQDEEGSDICDTIGIVLGSLFWIYIIFDIYFLKCAYSLLMRAHINKSESTTA